MALNFPTSPSIGDTYTIGTKTWVWNGVAWEKYNPITVSTSTVSTSTSTGAVTIEGGVGINGGVNIESTSTIAGAYILTTATLLSSGDVTITDNGDGTLTISGSGTLQSVTDAGSTTTNIVYFTNTTNSTSTTTGAVIIDGGIGLRHDLVAGGTVQAEHLRIQDAVMDSSYTLSTGTSTVVIDQYQTNIYRSSKYLVQIEEDAGANSEFEIIEILLLVTNTGTVYTTDYGLITSNGELGEFSSEVDDYTNPSDPLLKLYFTPFTTSTKIITVCRTAVTK